MYSHKVDTQGGVVVVVVVAKHGVPYKHNPLSIGILVSGRISIVPSCAQKSTTVGTNIVDSGIVREILSPSHYIS